MEVLKVVIIAQVGRAWVILDYSRLARLHFGYTVSPPGAVVNGPISYIRPAHIDKLSFTDNILASKFLPTFCKSLFPIGFIHLCELASQYREPYPTIEDYGWKTIMNDHKDPC
jgi:hypothetical protein